MKIKLPFVYSADVVVGKKKNPATHFFVDTVVADIPETSGAEARVALAWTSSNRADLEQHVRLYDGGFYVPAARLQRDADAFTPDLLISPARFDSQEKIMSVAAMLEHKVAEPAWHAMNRLLGPKAELPPQPHEIKSTENSNEASSRSKAEDVARSLICVDGVVYRRVEEPVLVVSVNRAAHAPTVTLDVGYGPRALGAYVDLDEGTLVSDPSTTKFFPISDLEGAEEAAGSYGFPVVRKFTGEPSQVVTDAFSFDREAEVVVRTVEYSIESIRAGIARFDSPTIKQWLAIREEFEQWKREGGRDIVEDLASEAVPRLAEMIAHLEPGVTDAIEVGLGEWNEGTISVSFGGGHRP